MELFELFEVVFLKTIFQKAMLMSHNVRFFMITFKIVYGRLTIKITLLEKFTDMIFNKLFYFAISIVVHLSAKTDSPLNFHLAEIRFTVLLATSFRFPIGNYPKYKNLKKSSLIKLTEA